MKEIKEIKENTANGAVIESFEGTVVTVYPPKEPTEGQKKAGIHRQGIVISDDRGMRLNIGLLKERMHMDKGCENTKFRFESTNGEKGMSGLVASHWQKSDTELVVSVDVNGSANVYALGNDAPKAHAQTEQKPVAEAKSQDPLLGAKNYMGFYREIFDVTFEAMDSTAVTASDMKDIATHYMIGLQQRGELANSIRSFVQHSRTPAVPPVDLKTGVPESSTKEPDLGDGGVMKRAAEEEDSTPDPDVAPDEQPAMDMTEKEMSNDEPEVEKDWKKVESKGVLVSTMNKDDLINLCIKVLPFHASDKPTIKSVVRAAMFAKKEMELTYTDIYDIYDVMLQNEFPLGAINAAYSAVQKSTNREDDGLCFEILKDQGTFKELIKSQTPQDEQAA